MTNYYYLDQTSQKRGPLTKQQLQELVAQGVIGPDTLMETDGGHKGVAGQIPGLFTTTSPPSSFAVPPIQPPYNGNPQTSYQSPEYYPQRKTSGIFGILDFGFTRFITNVWISFIWTVIVIIVFLLWGLACLAGLATILQGGNDSAFIGGLLIFFLATTLAALYLLFARMGLELIVVVFRIETHLRTIRDKYEST